MDAGPCRGVIMLWGILGVSALSPYFSCARQQRLILNIVGGDSGAWIIDNEQGRVCGHVLAWCSKNNIAYFCPMEVLLEDIRRSLPATTVELPGAVETEIKTTAEDKEPASITTTAIVDEELELDLANLSLD